MERTPTTKKPYPQRAYVTVAQAKKSPKKRSTIERGIQYDRTTGKFIVERYSGMKDGKAVRDHKTFSTLEEARADIEQFRVDKRNGLPENASKRMTVSDCIHEFIDKAVREGRIERTTERGYRVICTRICQTPFGKVKLCDVGEKDICDYIAFVRENKAVKNATINKDLTLISSVLRYAVRSKYIKHNPAQDVPKLKKEHFENPPLTLEEVTLLREVLLEKGDIHLTVAVFLGMYQGLRRGEILGLKWGNISFEENICRIRETLTQVGGEIIAKSPKTESSTRDIYLNPRVKEILLKYRDYQAKHGVLSDYVMITPQGRRLNPTHLSKIFQEFINKNGLRHIRFHDLRHTFATCALENHVNPNAVSGALGHSTVAITLSIYTHKAKDGSRQVNEIMNDIF